MDKPAQAEGGRKEHITGNIARECFRQLEGDIAIEQQSSASPAIDRLLEYTRELNGRLHSMHIDEAERCILASCILLALKLPHFRGYYKQETSQPILANRMIADVMDWLKKENIGNEKLGIIEAKYVAIRGMFLEEGRGLQALISDMEENIESFEKNRRCYDVLGQLYVTFLQYANTSGDLGVVLTPSHIAELFADMAGVNSSSVVFDNCAGTCGFLIAAMNKMMEDARGDKPIEDSIKGRQLIGIEKVDKMYCLAVSNMALHGDGKANIHFGSGLDPDTIGKIREMRPTVGMLNPPYKADKKNDVEELEFVKWNLEALVEGGTCVAIVPMQCAIATGGKIALLKEELLARHTLEAVFSMPDELFYNSDKSVVTCVMVFTAHKPHSKDKETFFGYFKDDGFEKRKKLGRVDVHNRWEGIKAEWLRLYRNRKEATGKSVMRHVGAKDEWCAETYMETDYGALTEADFVKTLQDYAAFLVKSGRA